MSCGDGESDAACRPVVEALGVQMSGEFECSFGITSTFGDDPVRDIARKYLDMPCSVQTPNHGRLPRARPV